MWGIIIGITGFYLILYYVAGAFKNNNSGSLPSENTRQRTPSSPQKKLKPQNTYRPKASSKPKIRFDNSPSGGRPQNPGEINIDGLNDAYSGAPLDRSLGLNQCENCKVFYHDESFEVLKQMNGSQCAACGSKSIRSWSSKSSSDTGRNYDPNIITLSNYKHNVGQVITFEGKVIKVRVSRRGVDYAVMFENKSWVHGFKLVFFQSSIERCGGPDYIRGLQGNTIRVRGLLAKDPNFGYEIIISERSMILEDNLPSNSSNRERFENDDLPF